jgi:hypothetical protein
MKDKQSHKTLSVVPDSQRTEQNMPYLEHCMYCCVMRAQVSESRALAVETLDRTYGVKRNET